MGKKSKTTVKPPKMLGSLGSPELPVYDFADLSLDQFEKTLASMLETLNNKRLEFLKATQLNSPKCLTNQLEKTPIKGSNQTNGSKYNSEGAFAIPDPQWTFPNNQHIHDHSTASSGSIDSSHTFMFPQSSSKMKEVIYRRSSEGSAMMAMKTPGPNIANDRDWNALNTTNWEDGMTVQGTNTLSDIKTPSKEEYEYMNNLFSHSTIQRNYGGRNENEYRPNRINNFVDLVEKKPDMYTRGNRYFMLGELSLETLLHRIYFEKYTYNDLREYIPFVLRKVASLESFLDTLYNEVQEFALTARDHILERLLKVVIKGKKLIRERNGEFKVTQEFGGYKRFGVHANQYVGLIKKIKEACKSLESVATESERVCSIYLNIVLHERRKFCCKEFHGQIFTKYFYNEPVIKDFLLSITRYFQERTFYASKYSRTTKHLQQINEFFAQWQPASPKQAFDGLQARSYEDYDFEGEGNSCGGQISPNGQNCVVRDLQKVYKSMETPDLCENTSEKNDIQTKNKNKKKKKKNNKKANKQSNLECQTETLPADKNQSEGIDAEKPAVQDRKSIVKSIDDIDWSKWPQGDEEINEFAKRLEQEKNSEDYVKVKPNISQDWIEDLKKKLKKKRFIM